MSRINIDVTREQMVSLETIAKARRITICDVIRELLTLHLTEDAPTTKGALRMRVLREKRAALVRFDAGCTVQHRLDGTMWQLGERAPFMDARGTTELGWWITPPAGYPGSIGTTRIKSSELKKRFRRI